MLEDLLSDNVNGNADSGGSVTCGDVGGNVDAGGSDNISGISDDIDDKNMLSDPYVKFKVIIWIKEAIER